MLSIEAMLTVPLTMLIFSKGILFVKPIQIRLEHQTGIIARQCVSPINNQHLFKIEQTEEITKLETNPQKTRELISLAHDLNQIFEDHTGN